jgi:hypothetical protein
MGPFLVITTFVLLATLTSFGVRKFSKIESRLKELEDKQEQTTRLLVYRKNDVPLIDNVSAKMQQVPAKRLKIPVAFGSVSVMIYQDSTVEEAVQALEKQSVKIDTAVGNKDTFKIVAKRYSDESTLLFKNGTLETIK